jgi:DNA-binding HxlR family transcriptional regulator
MPQPLRSDLAEVPALDAALAAVGDRWTLLVVNALLGGPRRFGELQQAIPEIAPNILTDRLRRLGRDALIVARPYSQRPVRMSYELSAAGAELGGVLRLLAGWGARNVSADSSPRHALCGTSLEARWWCPTCQEPVEDVGAEDLHFV